MMNKVTNKDLKPGMIIIVDNSFINRGQQEYLVTYDENGNKIAVCIHGNVNCGTFTFGWLDCSEDDFELPFETVSVYKAKTPGATCSRLYGEERFFECVYRKESDDEIYE